MPGSFSPQQVDSETSEPRQLPFILWVDGVGTYLLSLADRLTVGGPTLNGTASDLTLLANLSRRHASIIRTREGYFVEAHSSTTVADKEVYDRAHLNDGCEMQLGDSVQLRFRLPTELSASARIEFISDHRPSYSIDGVVLMDDTCLLGPGNENHIKCPDWPGAVLLYRKGQQLWCKSRLGVFVGDRHTVDGVPLSTGDIITGPDLRFRIESIRTQPANG